MSAATTRSGLASGLGNGADFGTGPTFPRGGPGPCGITLERFLHGFQSVPPNGSYSKLVLVTTITTITMFYGTYNS